MNQAALLGTEDTRYSLKTLHAMHYGAMYSGVSDRGILHVEFTAEDGIAYTGNIISIASDGVLVYAIDHIPATWHVTPDHILHAEVV